MRSGKRLTALLLAVSICISCAAFDVGGEATAAEPVVHIGMYVNTYVLDSRRFSALNVCENSFLVGWSDGDRFHPLFDTGTDSIIVLPQTGATADYDGENGDCVPGNGDIGAYGVCVASYADYASARAEADRRDGGYVVVTGRSYEVCVGNAGTEERARALAAGELRAPVAGGITVLDAVNRKILLMYADVSHRFALADSAGGTVRLPMKHYSGTVYRYDYPGFFEYSVEDGLLRMINCLGLEMYTKCVMANEIGINFSRETRRAFSVLARTFAMGRKHRDEGFDVCGCEACCQVYGGVFRMGEDNNAVVDSTRGLICTYKEEPITVLYHGANGGATCSSVAAWGGVEVPYLNSVFLENDEMEEGERWELTFTRSEFFDYLRMRPSFSSLQDDEISMRILGTDPYGSDYITVLSVNDGDGNVVTLENSERIRNAIGFSSANFKIEYAADIDVVTSDGTVQNRRVTGILTADGFKKFTGFGDSYETVSGGTVAPDKIIVSGVGSGHGVGFSATGAEKLTREGYNYQYLLTFFFDGTQLKQLY